VNLPFRNSRDNIVSEEPLIVVKMFGLCNDRKVHCSIFQQWTFTIESIPYDIRRYMYDPLESTIFRGWPMVLIILLGKKSEAKISRSATGLTNHRVKLSKLFAMVREFRRKQTFQLCNDHKSPLPFFNREHSQSKASPVIFVDNAWSTGINNCSWTIKSPSLLGKRCIENKLVSNWINQSPCQVSEAIRAVFVENKHSSFATIIKSTASFFNSEHSQSKAFPMISANNRIFQVIIHWNQ
jgi:hypothetical protein